VCAINTHIHTRTCHFLLDFIRLQRSYHTNGRGGVNLQIDHLVKVCCTCLPYLFSFLLVINALILFIVYLGVLCRRSTVPAQCFVSALCSQHAMRGTVSAQCFVSTVPAQCFVSGSTVPAQCFGSTVPAQCFVSVLCSQHATRGTVPQ
jgi:hypothetical protein